MNAQTELDIPATAADRARPVLLHLQAEVEKRSKAVESAEEKLAEARHLMYLQEQTIARLGAAEGGPTTAADPVFREIADSTRRFADDPDDRSIPSPVRKALDDMKSHAEANGIGVSISVNGGPKTVIAEPPSDEPPAPAVNPETGEVASVTIQATEGGPTLQVEVGPHTRFSNLVVVHINEQGIDADVDDFTVLALHPEEHAMFGTECDQRSVIPASMWGSNFRVVPKGGEPS